MVAGYVAESAHAAGDRTGEPLEVLVPAFGSDQDEIHVDVGSRDRLDQSSKVLARLDRPGPHDVVALESIPAPHLVRRRRGRRAGRDAKRDDAYPVSGDPLTHAV